MWRRRRRRRRLRLERGRLRHVTNGLAAREKVVRKEVEASVAQQVREVGLTCFVIYGRLV
jgi:hypothetical protein